MSFVGKKEGRKRGRKEVRKVGQEGRFKGRYRVVRFPNPLSVKSVGESDYGQEYFQWLRFVNAYQII